MPTSRGNQAREEADVPEGQDLLQEDQWRRNTEQQQGHQQARRDEPGLLTEEQWRRNMANADGQPPPLVPPRGAEDNPPPPPPPNQAGGGQPQGRAQAGQDDLEATRAELDHAVRRIRELEHEHQQDTILAPIDLTAAGAIARWSGGAGDTETAEQWLEAVTTVRGIKSWSEEQARKAMIFNLRGEARTWYQTMVQDVDGEAVNTLASFTKAFLERFRTLKTPSEVISMISNLKQKGGESVQAFWDRVNNSFFEATKKEMADIEGDEAAKKATRVFARALSQKFFVAGLNQDLQRLISPQLTELEDSKALIKKCVELEASQGQTKRAVAELATAREAELLKEVNALRAKLGPGSSGGNSYARMARGGATAGQSSRAYSRGAAGNRGRGASRSFNIDPERVKKRREWVYCHGCYTWGKHFQRECKATPAELRTLRQENGREKPSGEARDRYYR